MRLIDILPDSFVDAPSLMEINLLNAMETKERIAKMSEKIRSPKHRRWFQTALFRHLMAKGDLALNYGGSNHLDRLNRGTALMAYGFSSVNRLPKDAEPWARSEMDKGGELFKYKFTQTMLATVKQVILWLNKGVKPEKSINMNFETADMASSDWLEKETERKRKAEMQKMAKKGTRTIAEYPDGHYWVHLRNKACVKDEGERQRNCLKKSDAYDEWTNYYSLRNKKGESIVTMSANGGNVQEVFKQSNKDMDPRYYSYFIDIMDRLDLRIDDEWKFSRGIAEYAKEKGYIVVHAEEGYKFYKEYNEDRILRASSRFFMETTRGGEWKTRERELGNTGVFQMRYYLFDKKGKKVVELARNKDAGNFKLKSDAKTAKSHILDILEFLFLYVRGAVVPYPTMNSDAYEALGLKAYGVPRDSSDRQKYRKELRTAISRMLNEA